MSLDNTESSQSFSKSDDQEYLLSSIRATPTKPPWEDWKLNEGFLLSLTEYSAKNPDNALNYVLDRIYTCIDSKKDYLAVIPASPFPAQSLVMALGILLSLGIIVKRAKNEAYEFAKQVVDWVVQLQSAFKSTRMQNTEFNLSAWESLRNARDLINEICLWAHSRLKDRRWKRIKNAFTVGQEIDEFKKRLQNSKELFRDFSFIHLQGGMSTVLSGLSSVQSSQDKIMNEIMLIKMTQSEYLIRETEEMKKRKDRKDFLKKNLDCHTVTMSGYDTQGRNLCSQGTRKVVLKAISKWLKSISPGAQNILWLTGDPGCGKSAIAASLAARCKDEDILCAQLFINRNIVQTTDPKAFFPTISRQIADFSSEVETAIFDKLKNRPTLVDSMTSDQATQLFSDALIVAAKQDTSKVVVVIIDGLDEIERHHLRDTASILSDLFNAFSQSPNVKIFISSRTEDDIRKPFHKQIQAATVKHVHLDTTSSINDVSSFLKKRLRKIYHDRDLNKAVWPTNEQIEKLASRASGLFIWAVTALEYIKERIDEDGFECVNSVVDELTGEGLNKINELYSLILQTTLIKYRSRNEWALEKFRRIVGAIVFLRQPLTLHDLSGLLDIRSGSQDMPADVVNFVRRLRTVLVSGIEVIDEKTIPRPHNSFVEFITTKDMFSQGGNSLDDRFCVDPQIAEAELASSCIKRISSAFKKKNTTAPLGGLEYALRFCLSHVNGIGDDKMASISLVLPDAETKVEDVRSRCMETQQYGSLSPWFPIDYDRPLTAPFSPLTSAYQPTRESEIQLFTDTVYEVNHLAYSPNGEKLVCSFLEDSSLVLWDVMTGTEIAKLEGHCKAVRSISFSPSSDRIVSVSEDGTIRLWDATTGQLVKVIHQEEADTSFVKHSCDGKFFATDNYFEETLCLWDAYSGELISPLDHGDEVFGAVFTPDGKLMISCSSSHLYIWDKSTLHFRSKLKIPISNVFEIAISPSGDRMVVIGDEAICLFNRSGDDFVFDNELFPSLNFNPNDAAFHPDGRSILFQKARLTNGQNFNFAIFDLPSRTLIPLVNQNMEISKLALSPDGSSITFGCGKQILIAPIPKLLPVTLVVLSPNGDMAACVFCEGTIWLATPGKLPSVRIQLEGKVGRVVHLLFNSDNTLLAGVDDEFIYLWDVSTRVLLGSASCKNLPLVTGLSFLDDRRTVISIHGYQIMNAWITYYRTLLPHGVGYSSSLDFAYDCKLSLDFDEGSVREFGGARFYAGNKEGRNSGVWAFIDDSLMRVGADGSVTLLPFNSSTVSGLDLNALFIS